MHSAVMEENERTLRTSMKEMLAKCTEAQQDLFRRMYNHEGKFEHAVDGIPANKMDWAFKQIENTLISNWGLKP